MKMKCNKKPNIDILDALFEKVYHQNCSIIVSQEAFLFYTAKTSHIAP